MSDPSSAILVVAILLLVKESGLPVPVPGDLLVIGAGVAAAAAMELPIGSVLLVVAATVVGGAIQFALIRGPGRRAMLRLLGRFGIGEARVRARVDALGGARSVAIARMTPGIRIVAIPAAAMGVVAPRAFLAGLAVGNGVFTGGHFALGYLVGAPAVALASRAIGPMAIAIVVLAAVGAGGWWLIGRRRASLRDGGASGSRPFAEWADAACPACLALAAVRPGVEGSA